MIASHLNAAGSLGPRCLLEAASRLAGALAAFPQQPNNNNTRQQPLHGQQLLHSVGKNVAQEIVNYSLQKQTSISLRYMLEFGTNPSNQVREYWGTTTPPCVTVHILLACNASRGGSCMCMHMLLAYASPGGVCTCCSCKPRGGVCICMHMFARIR